MKPKYVKNLQQLVIKYKKSQLVNQLMHEFLSSQCCIMHKSPPNMASIAGNCENKLSHWMATHMQRSSRQAGDDDDHHNDNEENGMQILKINCTVQKIAWTTLLNNLQYAAVKYQELHSDSHTLPSQVIKAQEILFQKLFSSAVTLQVRNIKPLLPPPPPPL